VEQAGDGAGDAVPDFGGRCGNAPVDAVPARVARNHAPGRLRKPALGTLRSLREELADGLSSSQAHKRGPGLRHDREEMPSAACGAPGGARSWSQRIAAPPSRPVYADCVDLSAWCRLVRRHPGSFASSRVFRRSIPLNLY